MWPEDDRELRRTERCAATSVAGLGGTGPREKRTWAGSEAENSIWQSQEKRAGLHYYIYVVPRNACNATPYCTVLKDDSINTEQGEMGGPCTTSSCEYGVAPAQLLYRGRGLDPGRMYIRSTEDMWTSSQPTWLAGGASRQARRRAGDSQVVHVTIRDAGGPDWRRGGMGERRRGRLVWTGIPRRRKRSGCGLGKVLLRRRSVSGQQSLAPPWPPAVIDLYVHTRDGPLTHSVPRKDDGLEGAHVFARSC